MEKVWEIAPRRFDDIIEQILYNRGIFTGAPDQGMIERFLKPDFERDLPDPFLMKGMKEAVLRIKKAHEASEKIGIFADYDADGIPGAALLYRGLTKIGFKPEVFIPNREKGYGLSKEGIDFLIGKGCTLIITVDLGIRNFEEALYCQEKNVDLIITDHHIPDQSLPSAFIVINPKQPGDKYPFKELAGCGVAFKLLQGLSTDFLNIDDRFLKWNLDLVGVSTISDVVPLVGENRVLARYGILVNQKTHNLGLRKLIEGANIVQSKIDGYSLGFQIGPRINAPGRIDHATKSFELLVSENEEEANELAAWLEEKNLARQAAMDQVIKEVDSLIDSKNLLDNKIIIVSGDWQKGVIGPSASKIVEKYNRPTILFSASDEKFTGSARSVSGVDILELIKQNDEFVEKYGGHKGAAGLAITNDKYKKFVQAMIDTANKLDDDLLRKKVRIDSLILARELKLDLYEQIIQLEPFGMGNPKPVFAIENVKFESQRFVGKEKNHLSATVVFDGNRYKSIFFSFPYDRELLRGEYFDVAFSVGIDEWNDKRSLSLNIIDIRPKN